MDSTIDEAGMEAGLAMTLLFEGKDLGWRRNGRVLTTPVALMSAELTTALMKSAVFSVNLHDVYGRGVPEITQKGVEGRAVMIALGFDYAIDAAPRSDDATPEGACIIDCQDLFDQIAEIEEVFGRIPFDAGLVSSIMSAARMRLMAPIPAAAPGGVAS